ncbi:MAG TPA: NAD(P)/FAD-dependent oxidoreductase [Chitinophagaceae bacterium]
MKKNVVIVGAGLVGSLLAIYLCRRGYQVRIFERRGDMRSGQQIAGRSINLALSDRGIRALEEVGAMDAIREIAIPMHGRFIHNADGTTAFQAYGKEGQFINSVSRGELNKVLMTVAENSGAQIFFNQKCTGVNWNEKLVEFDSTCGEESETIGYDLLFGADGAYSAVRLQHMLQHDRFEYRQSYIDFGYKELTIPAAENGGFRIEKHALHIWPRGNFMLIALPNTDGSFTCTLFFPFEGETSFASLDSKEKVRTFFQKTFTDAYTIMPELEDEFFRNPTSSLVTVKCYPWTRGESFTLIGDAAHAIVPFFGQGMNCGFEDCAVLDDLVGRHNEDWGLILSEFQQLRKPDADAIADLALDNFIEMRDKVGNPRFLLQKKIESRLHQKYPEKWIPVYAQVTFSPHIRYSEAQHRGAKQEAIMSEIMNLPGIEGRWDSEEVEQMILSKLHASI